jgi:site-specific DNA recombinase
VRVFCYQTGEVKMHDPLSVAMMQLRVSFATMERQGSVRTHDAMGHKAKAGHAVGGRVFGYTTTEPRAPDGRRLHVERRVHEAEATVVRRIFTLYAEGVGYPTIAHTLNHERALAPSPRRTGRLAGWAPSSVREILYRELYRGVVVWNRTKKRDPFGRKRHSQRDPADWIRLEAPTLRIVSHELWTAVQRRLEQARASYLRVNGGKVWGRPPGDVDTKYLLTALTVCGHCGGTLHVRSRAHGCQRFFYYACSTANLKGKTHCSNFLRLPMDLADEAVLAATETDLLHPAVVTRAIEKTHAALVAAAPESSDQVKAAEATVARLSTELARLVEAVRHGGAIPALVSEIQRLEIERTRAEAQLAALRTPAPMLTADDLPAAIERVLTDWRGLLRRQTAQARQILRRLLHRRVVFTPDLRAGTWTMRAECSLGRGYSVQRLWWPQRGSNPCFSLERAVS